MLLSAVLPFLIRPPLPRTIAPADAP
jgi:hypothetical protein